MGGAFYDHEDGRRDEPEQEEPSMVWIVGGIVVLVAIAVGIIVWLGRHYFH